MHKVVFTDYHLLAVPHSSTLINPAMNHTVVLHNVDYLCGNCQTNQSSPFTEDKKKQTYCIGTLLKLVLDLLKFYLFVN